MWTSLPFFHKVSRAVGAFGILTVVAALIYAGIYKIVPSLLMIVAGAVVCTVCGMALVVKPEDKTMLLNAEKQLQEALYKITGQDKEYNEQTNITLEWQKVAYQNEKLAGEHKAELEKAKSELAAAQAQLAKSKGPPLANDNPEKTNPKIQKPPEVINRTRNPAPT